jgi:hypothetical protein
LVALTLCLAQARADAESAGLAPAAAVSKEAQAVLWDCLQTLAVKSSAEDRLFFEDGIYDDPFASNAHALRGTLKRVFSSGAQLEGGGTWLRKDYRASPPLDLDGTVNAAAGTRADRISRAGDAWTQPVLRNRTGPIGLDLVVDYWHTTHHSNDAFYNYTSHALGLGVSVSY